MYCERGLDCNVFLNTWLNNGVFLKITFKTRCPKFPDDPSHSCRDTRTKEMSWLMDVLISNVTQSKKQNCAAQFETHKPNKMWQRSSSDTSSPAEQGVPSRLVGDFVSLHSPEAPFKLRLMSLLCTQLKTIPNQAKNVQSHDCQCLFTIKQRALLVHHFQGGMNKNERNVFTTSRARGRI